MQLFESFQVDYELCYYLEFRHQKLGATWAIHFNQLLNSGLCITIAQLWIIVNVWFALEATADSQHNTVGTEIYLYCIWVDSSWEICCIFKDAKLDFIIRVRLHSITTFFFKKLSNQAGLEDLNLRVFPYTSPLPSFRLFACEQGTSEVLDSSSLKLHLLTARCIKCSSSVAVLCVWCLPHADVYHVYCLACLPSYFNFLLC